MVVGDSLVHELALVPRQDLAGGVPASEVAVDGKAEHHMVVGSLEGAALLRGRLEGVRNVPLEVVDQLLGEGTLMVLVDGL